MKPVLVFNSVNWSEAYDSSDPLWSVGDWFRNGWNGNERPLDIRHVKDEDYPNLDGYSGLILTGSPSSAYDKDDWIARLSGVILEAVDRKLPTLGVCFGHQLIAQALGGRVEPNPKGWEIGDPEVVLTEEGRADPIFDGIPNSFRVIQSHRDIVTEMPEESVLLASNGLCSIQAYAIGDYLRTVQFHPEMNPEHLRYILGPRREKILESSGIDIHEVLPKVCSTPDSRRIFRNFEKHFVK
ncbi:MAG: type 1 glutamine amidotransferase [Candidatus Omnitrophica bacterium]|nr:type 1 glutamine amidotransferase [Candidatus Omnitrophota bacterium]